MDIITTVILGAIQGITEWIPISSKTQVTLAYLGLFNQDPNSLIPVILFAHIGTLLAATIYFRKEIYAIAQAFLAKPFDKNTYLKSETGFIFGAIALTGIIGVPILIAESILFQNLDGKLLFALMGAGLIFTGILLLTQKGAKQKKIGSVGLIDGMATGALQALSTIPGVSRSGTTTTALIWRGFDAESAFHLSFVLSIPTVIVAEITLYMCGLGAGPVIFVSDILTQSKIQLLASLGGKIAEKCAGTVQLAMPDALLLMLVSFIVGYLTLDFILKAMKKVNLAYVAIAWGILIIAFGLIGAS